MISAVRSSTDRNPLLWRRWFAWYPVYITAGTMGCWVWWQWIERRYTFGYDSCDAHYRMLR